MSPRSVLAAALASLALACAGASALAADRAIPLRVPAGGHAGFTVVDLVAAGLRFTNTLAPMAAVENQNLMNGSGVAAGDVDGDGLCDLYFAAIDGTNRLYRNLGGWRFEDITQSAGVACPHWHSTGAVLADIDGDGDLDLLVSTLGDGVHCFLNDGLGHFREVTAEAGLASKTGSMSLALGDLRGTGGLDLYVANYGAIPVLRSGGRAEVKMVNGQWVIQGPFAHRLRLVNKQIEEVGEAGVLYQNDGHGRFSPVPWDSDFFLDEHGQRKAAPADYGLSVQIRDMNGDGHPDIYTCNDFQSPDRMWLNDGRGRFREASHLALRKFSFSSMGVDFADIDRDGRMDFMTVEMSPRGHARRLRSMTGPRFLPNVPGRYEYRPEVARNTLFHGDGDGAWSEVAEFAGVGSTDWSWQPVFLDVDLDGYEDLLVASGMMYDTQDRDTLDRIRAAHPQPGAQGGTNLLLYPPFPSPVSAFRSRGDFTFEDARVAWGFTLTNIYQGVALADLDGDGDLDLVFNCLNSAPVLFRNETSAPRVAVRAKGLPPNTRGVNARITVTGGPVTQSQEIVSGGRYLSGDDAIRVFAAGGAKSLAIEVRWRGGRRSVINDVRPDTLYEVDEASASQVEPPSHPPAKPPLFADQSDRLHHVHHEKLFDDFARQPLLPKQFSSLGPAVAWVDLDGDGRDELVIGAGKGGNLAGYRFGADGRVEPLVSEWTAPDDVTGMSAWVAADGAPALLAALANYEIYPNASTLVLVTARPGASKLEVAPFDEVPPSDASLGALAAADYDADGSLDLFVGARVAPGAYPRPVRSHLYHRRQGRLSLDAAAEPLLEGAGMVAAAAWSDLGGEGYPDLVLACEWGPLRILRNRRGALERWDPPVTIRGAGPGTSPLSTLTGWWTSVAAGDFDGDGRLDLVVGNWGLNSGYRAAPATPVRLYYGDLTGLGGVDLIESYYPPELGIESPRRSRNALAQAMPVLSERFPTHAAFSEAAMPAILGALATKPDVVSATTLASLVLLNRGDHFEAVPLPTPAQWAPVMGLSVADVDGDGREDVLLSQHYFATRLEWPRTDAGRGLVLLGDGAGSFQPMEAGASGVAIHGEGRGCAVGDFDGDGRVDWVAAQNGAETKLYRNQTGLPGVRVQLKGPAGNPAGVGAVLWLKRDGKLGPAREVHAGAGYWSQDSAVQILGAWEPGLQVRVRWPGGQVQEQALVGGRDALHQVKFAP